MILGSLRPDKTNFVYYLPPAVGTIRMRRSKYYDRGIYYDCGPDDIGSFFIIYAQVSFYCIGSKTIRGQIFPSSIGTRLPTTILQDQLYCYGSRTFTITKNRYESCRLKRSSTRFALKTDVD